MSECKDKTPEMSSLKCPPKSPGRTRTPWEIYLPISPGIPLCGCFFCAYFWSMVHFQYALGVPISFRKSLIFFTVPRNLTFSSMTIRRYSTSWLFLYETMCPSKRIAKYLVKPNTMRATNLNKCRKCYLRKNN